MSKCRSPPFLCKKIISNLHEKEDIKMADKKKYYLFVRNKKIEVDEHVYKEYYKLLNHERYLRRKDLKNRLLPFSSLDKNEYSFEETIPDKGVDIEKVVETSILIDRLTSAIDELNDEEKEIIERLYFNDESLRSVAKLKDITHPALIKRRNKILEKLKKFIEEI